jgi:hypothetical protein
VVRCVVLHGEKNINNIFLKYKQNHVAAMTTYKNHLKKLNELFQSIHSVFFQEQKIS